MAHLEGRCYRISWDEAPLYRTPKDTRQAMMFVDTSDLAARFLDTQADAALTNAKELLYAPLFGLANGLAGPEQAGLRVQVMAAIPPLPHFTAPGAGLGRARW